MADASLLFKIKGDSSDAVKAFKDVEAAGKGSTESLSAAFAKGTFAGNLLHDAVSKVTQSVIELGPALFNLAKAASDYGSEIYDASLKTGLTTETLSALKFQADLSGSSFEQLTKGVVVFGTEVGKAANGNDKAVAKMKELGVTSNDLRTALGQAVKTIFEAKDETDQLRLANEAFGRKLGADLIPLIKDTEGNLDKLEKTARDLGLTLTEEDAKAADEFGDTLAVLSAQAEAVGRAFIGPLMKDITTSMDEISGAMAKNKKAAEEWGESLRGLVSGIKNIGADFYQWSQTQEGQFWKNVFFGGLQIIGAGIQEQATPQLQPRSTGPVTPSTGAWKALGTVPGGASLPSVGDKEAQAAAEKAKREAEKRAKERQDILTRDANAQIGILRLQLKDQTTEYEEFFDRVVEITRQGGDVSADVIIKREQEMAAETQETLNRINEIQDQQAKNDNKRDDEKRFLLKQQIAFTQDIENQRIKIVENATKEIDELAKKSADQRKKEADEHKKRIGNWNKLREVQKEVYDESTKLIDADIKKEDELHEKRVKNWNERRKMQKDLSDDEEEYRKKQLRDTIYGGPKTIGGQVLGGIGKALGTGSVDVIDQFGNLKTAAKMTEDVYTHMAEVAGEAIGQMVDGLAQLALNWIITGEFSAKAALQMMASIALSLATQAGMEALMEFARGMAASAKAVINPIYAAEAALHFAAAKAFLVVAAVAGGAGIGLALGARAAGGGGGGSSASSPSNLTEEKNVTPISRTSGGAYTSGNPIVNAVQASLDRHAAATEALNAKIGSMQPHEVMTRAENQKPGITATHAVNGISSNGGLGTRLQRVTGARR